MPRIEASTTVPVPAAVAFRLSQTQGEVRYRWDPFVREQHLLGGATAPAKGVQSFTRSRHGLKMVSEYLTFSPPTNVGMKMIDGPWFFRTFSGGWHFTDHGDGTTAATWRYSFTIRPKFLSLFGDPIGQWLLQRDIRRRLTSFANACSDPDLLAAAEAQSAALG